MALSNAHDGPIPGLYSELPTYTSPRTYSSSLCAQAMTTGRESHEKAGLEDFACEVEAAQGSHSDVFGNEEEHDIRYKTLSWQVSRGFHPLVVSGLM